MVRLERITMQGFKSFAGKVTIPFPAGFNIVCGPNGTGKSNIVDALTFVLGTSSARSIRAQKLQNLIFNGGTDKKPAEFCEVTLYLDNSDNKIPINENEVKVTRRITRSGISIYKLNGRTVTRSKIQDLLANANMSSDGYNIIMQGDVTKIIEMGLQERREIIDEVAGIKEFDEKREKATRELERVELRVRENMIVVAEKQKYVQRLKSEKENAEKYANFSEKLQIYRASLLHKKLAEAEEKAGIIDKEIDEKTSLFEEKSKIFTESEKDLETKEKLMRKIDEEIMQKTKNIDILRKADAIRTEILRKKDRIDFNEREISRLKEFETPERNIAIKEILNMKSPGIHGTLDSLIGAPSEYSTAIEVAVGRHSKDIVVSDHEIATSCIKHLKARKIGRARFLPLDRIRGREKKEYKGKENIIGYAIDLVKYNRKFSPAVEFVLGSTIVVKNIDIAKKIKGYRVVTLDGDLVEPSGAMIGGFYRKTHRESFAPKIRQLEEDSEKLEDEISALDKELGKYNLQDEGETANVREDKVKIEKEIEIARKKWKEMFEEKMIQQNGISRLKIEKARIEANLENLNIEMEEFKDVKDFEEGSIDVLQEKVRYFVTEINRLGPVNMKAIEEYKTINVEFEELKKNLNKLLEEKNAIVSIAEDVEKKRYDKFMETFNEIAAKFSTTYYDMAGGTGRLRLEEENKIDSGLIIEASPSGKKVLNLDSMSGGEKTLTSLAFLFAILQHYLTPFYVLDEVDAALDKANTKKIADLIKKYSKSVQFIVISHNDLTIAEADKVFGVSMENGVSKVFGIELPVASE